MDTPSTSTILMSHHSPLPTLPTKASSTDHQRNQPPPKTSNNHPATTENHHTTTPPRQQLAFSTRLKETHTQKAILLTTFDLDEYMLSATQPRASGFHLKDAPPQELLESIRTYSQWRCRNCAVYYSASTRSGGSEALPLKRA